MTGAETISEIKFPDRNYYWEICWNQCGGQDWPKFQLGKWTLKERKEFFLGVSLIGSSVGRGFVGCLFLSFFTATIAWYKRTNGEDPDPPVLWVWPEYKSLENSYRKWEQSYNMKYILQNRKKGKSKYQNIFQGFYTSSMDQVNVFLTKQNHSASAAFKTETKPGRDKYLWYSTAF